MYNYTCKILYIKCNFLTNVLDNDNLPMKWFTQGRSQVGHHPWCSNTDWTASIIRFLIPVFLKVVKRRKSFWAKEICQAVKHSTTSVLNLKQIQVSDKTKRTTTVACAEYPNLYHIGTNGVLNSPFIIK